MARRHVASISKGGFRPAPLRMIDANRLELLQRVSYRFVSIALPFKNNLIRVNVHEFLDAH